MFSYRPLISLEGVNTYLQQRSKQGGPQNSKGCSCGVTGTCADPGRKCDINNNYGSDWHTDEGLVTFNEDLPLTGIAIRDSGSANVEVAKYTIVPLKCVI